MPEQQTAKIIVQTVAEQSKSWVAIGVALITAIGGIVTVYLARKKTKG